MVSSFQKQYSFPNVSVRETIRGPRAFTALWRNTIGVAAPFTKGPLVAEISSRQELVNLFGEDTSLGSVAVRQAMLQGATNFVISRALPKAKSASASISLVDANNLTEPYPTVGYTAARTSGLKIDFSFISEINVIDKNNVAYAVNNSNATREVTPLTNSESVLNLTGFEGLGYISLNKVSTLHTNRYTQITGAGLDEMPSSLTAVTTGVKTIKIKLPKSDANVIKYVEAKAIVPGMELASGVDDGADIAPVFDGTAVIVSEVFEESATHYAFYATVNVTTAGEGIAPIKLKIPTGNPTIDIFEVFFRPNNAEVLPGNYTVLPNLIRQQRGITGFNNPISYLTFDRENNPGDVLNLKYYKTDTDVDVLLPTNLGVTYQVGSSTDTYVEILAPSQSITIFRSSSSIGKTDAGGVAFEAGESAVSILTKLKSALYSNAVLSALNADIYANTSVVPFSLSIQIGAIGAIGNKVKYTVYAYNADGLTPTPVDLSFEENGTSLFGDSLPFVGGTDEVTPARRIFYGRNGEEVIYIESISPGKSGNNIRVNIKPVNDSNFIIEIREESLTSGTKPQSETFYLSNTTIDLLTGLYPETLGSNFVRIYYVPAVTAVRQELGRESINYNLVPLRLTPPNIIDGTTLLDLSHPAHPGHLGTDFLKNIPLLGGTEPDFNNAEISEQAYIDAIERLEERDISILIAPGLIAGDVRYSKAVDTLIQQANNSTPYNGLRIAVLATPPKLSAARAEILSSEYSSPRLVLLGGWGTLATAAGTGFNSFSSEGFYAGLVVVSDTYVSPASSYSNNYVIGARTVDSDTRLEVLDSITHNNIEIMYFDNISKKMKFLNGRTTAGDLDNRWVAIRRQADHIIMNVVSNLEWAKSSPNNREVQVRVASAVDAILKNEQRRGAIAGFTPTYVDTNNVERIAQGYMDILITWTPVFPADYISVEIVRTISNQFSLQISGV
jgi:hypothetical protein